MENIKVLDFDGLKYLVSIIQEKISDSKEIVLCENSLERESITSPKTNVLYIELSSLAVYIYDSAWKCLTSQEEISDEFIDELFVATEEGELLNTITPISDETIDEIWDLI